jgi:hypothetical protein
LTAMMKMMQVSFFCFYYLVLFLKVFTFSLYLCESYLVLSPTPISVGGGYGYHMVTLGFETGSFWGCFSYIILFLLVDRALNYFFASPFVFLKHFTLIVLIWRSRSTYAPLVWSQFSLP